MNNRDKQKRRLKDQEFNIKKLIDKLYKEHNEKDKNRKQMFFYEAECRKQDEIIKKLR